MKVFSVLTIFLCASFSPCGKKNSFKIDEGYVIIELSQEGSFGSDVLSIHFSESTEFEKTMNIVDYIDWLEYDNPELLIPDKELYQSYEDSLNELFVENFIVSDIEGNQNGEYDVYSSNVYKSNVKGDDRTYLIVWVKGHFLEIRKKGIQGKQLHSLMRYVRGESLYLNEDLKTLMMLNIMEHRSINAREIKKNNLKKYPVGKLELFLF